MYVQHRHGRGYNNLLPHHQLHWIVEVREIIQYFMLSIEWFRSQLIFSYYLSGCGLSDLGDPNEFSPDALVEDVKSLTKSHPLLLNKRFVLVGHSMGGRVAICYAAKYPNDVSALVIEDMDIRRRSVRSNFIPNFDEAKAIAFKRGHESFDSIKMELESIGYQSDMYTKWIDEGRIYEDNNGKVWSDVNPAFRALCYRTIFDSDSGTTSWNAIASYLKNELEERNSTKVYLMVAGIGTVCDDQSLAEMCKLMSLDKSGDDSILSMKTYEQGTHSIHNSARNDFMADLCKIIDNSK